jgi:ERF superfamily
MKSDELAELATALTAAQAEFSAIPKDAENPFFRSSYASLPKVVEVSAPVLTKHGLSITQFIGYDESGADTLTTWLLHQSGQYICQTMRLRPTKPDPQGQGSAVTYARRYSYMAALGLVADEDDDGNNASAPPPKQSKSAKPKTPPAPQKDGPKIALLSRAAHGLTIAQIKEALSSCGLPLDTPFNVKTAFAKVPDNKTGLLAEALGEIAR